MMEGSPGGSNSPPPFLTKTYEMVDDPATDSIVSWSTTNSSFIVRNPPEFSKDLLPKYFKHNNFSSFIRQLNTYGFRKVDPDQWEFANEEFIRGQKHLLKNIHRRKPIHSHSLHNQHIQGSSSGGLTELEKQEFEDEVEKLKHDKNLLMLELQKHTLEKQEIKTQMQFLETRFYKMEERQREVTGFLSRVMGKPEFVSNLVQLSEKNNKKRRLFKQDYFLDETCHEENPVVLFKPITTEESDGISLPTPNMVPFEKLESSLKSWENFLFRVCHASGEEMSNFGVPLQSTSLLSSEINTSSGEPDMNILPQSPVLHLGSSCSRDIHSSPELTESTCLAESPVISLIQLSVDVQLKSSGIDVNSKPAGSLEIETSNEPVVEAKSGQPARVNDVFWEQFLTETPGSSDTAEVQSERRDTVERKDVKSVDRGKYWWNVNRDNVDNLTEQMGQLTQAERT